jgi:hypothetical protein
MKRIALIITFPRLAMQILIARVQSTRTRLQVLLEVFDAISEVAA